MKSNKIYIAGAIFLGIGIIAMIITILIGIGSVARSSHGRMGKISDVMQEIFSEDYGEIVNRVYKAKNEVRELDIEEVNANISFQQTNDDRITISYDESVKVRYKVVERNGELSISRVDTKKWYSNIGMNFMIGHNREYNIKVMLPYKYSGDIEIDTINGAIELDRISADSIGINNVNGIISVIDAQVKDMDIESINSDIEVNNTEVKGSIEIDNVNGAISFERLNYGQELEVALVNGIICGSLCGNMSEYTIKSDIGVGDNSLPTSYNGGNKKLTIETVVGDIEVTFEEVY